MDLETMKDKRLTIALVVIILIFLSISVFLVYQNLQLNQQISSLNTQQPLMLIPTPTVWITPNQLTDTDVTNWKTYRMSRYDFSVQHPSEWQVRTLSLKEEERAEYWVIFESPETSHERIKDSYDYLPWIESSSMQKGFQVIVLKSEFSDRDLKRSGYNCNLDHEGCIFLFRREPSTFLNIPANKATAEFPKNVRELVGITTIRPYTYIIFNQSGKGWVIAYDHSDFSGTIDPVYNQILSTFKFLD